MPSASPLVAIATPVYNGEKYLAETMASVQAQVYPNLLHVVVDNASSDSSPAIIERYKHGKVPVISARNPQTIPVNENWSAAAALVPREAKYFALLCADDMLAPTAIQRMVEVAERDPQVELVGCVARRGGVIRPTDLPADRWVYDGKEIARRFLNKEADALPHMYGLYRVHREDFEGGFFPSDVVMMDTHACLRALVRGKLGYVHEPLAEIRLHPDQLFKQLLRESRHSVFEPLVLIDRWAPEVMSPVEAKKCRDRHLRVIYRFLLYWRASGQHGLVDQNAKKLADHDIHPSFMDYQRCVLEWPILEAKKRYRRRKIRRTAEALGYGEAEFPVDAALPRIMNSGVWRR